MGMHDPSGLQVAGARTDQEAHRTVAWLWGEHDIATADGLTEFLAKATTHAEDLVVDLSAVRFMDATTIAAIVQARSQMAERSQVLTVRSPSPLIELVFGICGLDALVEPTDALALDGRQRVTTALEGWVAVGPRTPVSTSPPPPALTPVAPGVS